MRTDLYMDLENLIERAWNDRSLLQEKEISIAINTIIEDLDVGRRRIAEPINGEWKVNEWLKKAVILYFPLMKMELIEVGPFQFHDKMKLKSGYDQLGVRVVPPAVARYGAYISKGCILMPSYVNIGAYVDEGTMVDTWATVGSCAQIGKRCT
jgi:2,3,4,5-tetrahydropyridine-2,6-dicarboxylate N-succinyltransferase